MAFNCTYRSLNEQNIRHIYSDQKLRIIYPHRHHFRSLREELPIPPLRLYPKRFYDYYPAYKIGIPRAPAFRGTSQDHVDSIVKRICQPMRREKHDENHPDGSRKKRGKKKITFEDDDKADNENGTDSDNEDEEDESNDDEKVTKMSRKDMDALLLRLQRPTESWERKKYDRDEREMERRRKEKESSIPKLPPIPVRV